MTQVEELIDRLEATIHRINGHWWNRRKRPEAPDIRAVIDLAASLQDRVARLEAALAERDQ